MPLQLSLYLAEFINYLFFGIIDIFINMTLTACYHDTQAPLCHFCHAGNNWHQNPAITDSIKIYLMHENAPCKNGLSRLLFMQKPYQNKKMADFQQDNQALVFHWLLMCKNTLHNEGLKYQGYLHLFNGCNEQEATIQAYIALFRAILRV